MAPLPQRWDSMTARYRRTRRSSAASTTGSDRNLPTPKILKAQRRIVDLLQVLVMKRPNMVCVVEDLLEGMLSESRKDDPPATNDED